ncbi:MAG: hypothetical protein S4CHLAM37_06650 [Chlamydiia bacterium]|nr:hypothetical protein [Chlamydiia bacterium]
MEVFKKMGNKQYEKTIAKLVSKNDMLETELAYLNRILVEVGFAEGTKTLKETVEEVISEDTEVVKVPRNNSPGSNPLF